MDTNFNYYLISAEVLENTPYLENDNRKSPRGLRFLSKTEEVSDDYVVKLCFFERVRNPNMEVDCLDMEASCVFSKKVRDALVANPIKYLQMVPTVIEEGKIKNTDFFIPNVFQRLKTFNEELSVHGSVMRGLWMSVKKIVLDKEVLKSIPLEDRLVYVAREDSQFILFHESVVNIIKSVNPVGISFTPIEEWNPGVAFDFMRQ